MLTPEDLKNKVFVRGFRGYDVDDVDKFMAEVRKEFEYLYLDNVELKETIERVTGKLEYYQQMEATMQSTLSVAQETADEVKANSQKQADLLERETEAKCQECMRAAQEEAQRMIDEATEKASELYSQIKVRTGNLKHAAELECQKMRDDADAYVTELRTTVEKETSELKAATEEVCKKHSDSTLEEAKNLLESARTESHEMMMEANTKYRNIVADAEERGRKIIFDAESKAVMAKNEYENIVKKTNIFRNNMTYLLRTQMEVLQNFENEGTEDASVGSVAEAESKEE